MEAYKKEFVEFINAEGSSTQQVFNCNETGVFWKKILNITSIIKEEKAQLEHKLMKDGLFH